MTTKQLHHIATAVGFAWLIGWYMLCKELGIMEYMTNLMPKGYEGAGLMLAIGLMMMPGFWIWSRFNRFVEKKLGVTGKYYEDSYYTQDEQIKKDRD
jgi:hypothetical protein